MKLALLCALKKITEVILHNGTYPAEIQAPRTVIEGNLMWTVPCDCKRRLGYYKNEENRSLATWKLTNKSWSARSRTTAASEVISQTNNTQTIYKHKQKQPVPLASSSVCWGYDGPTATTIPQERRGHKLAVSFKTGGCPNSLQCIASLRLTCTPYVFYETLRFTVKRK